MPGIVYLVQPCELVGTDRYKVGMLSDNDFKRLTCGYIKGSKWICVNEVIDPKKVKQKIVKLFKSTFKLIAGNEYFSGDILTMMTLFTEAIKQEYY